MFRSSRPSRDAASSARSSTCRTRRVPNPLTLGIAVTGLALAATRWSGLSVATAALGLAVGIGLMLPPYVFGAMGGGDVKLFAALGTFLGPWPTVQAFLYTLLAGGAPGGRGRAAAAPAAGNDRQRRGPREDRGRERSGDRAPDEQQPVRICASHRGRDRWWRRLDSDMRTQRSLVRRLCGQRGQALIETALTLPIVLVISRQHLRVRPRAAGLAAADQRGARGRARRGAARRQPGRRQGARPPVHGSRRPGAPQREPDHREQRRRDQHERHSGERVARSRSPIRTRSWC